MKNVLVLIVLVVLMSCQMNSNKSTKPACNDQQMTFYKFLQQESNEQCKTENDIQKNEFLEKYQRDLVQLIDSIGLIHNWIGTLEDFKLSGDDENAVVLTITIKLTIDEYHSITLHNECPLTKKQGFASSIDSSLIYQKLKNLTVGSQIYFDGFFSRTKYKKLDYPYSGISDNAPNDYNIDINFHFVSISADSLTFISDNKMSKIFDLTKECWSYMTDAAVTHKISSSVLSKNLKSIKLRLEPLIGSITAEERSYIVSLGNCYKNQWDKDCNE